MTIHTHVIEYTNHLTPFVVPTSEVVRAWNVHARAGTCLVTTGSSTSSPKTVTLQTGETFTVDNPLVTVNEALAVPQFQVSNGGVAVISWQVQ